jgi:hypothetical protein
MNNEILKEVPLEKLCIFHYKNRSYLDGNAKWTGKEKDKLTAVTSLAVVNLAVLIFGIWLLIFLFDFIKEQFIIFFIGCFLFLGLVAFNITELFEYLNAKELRKHGQLIIGRVTDCKYFIENTDNPTIILSYIFTTPTGENIRFTTSHIRDSGHYYIFKKFKFFSFEWFKREKTPKIGDFVIVQFFDERKSNANADLFDIL